MVPERSPCFKISLIHHFHIDHNAPSISLRTTAIPMRNHGLCELAYYILLKEWISKFDYMIICLVEDDAKTADERGTGK